MRHSQPATEATYQFFELLFGDADAGWLVLTHPDPAQPTPGGKPALLSDWFNVARASLATIAKAAQALCQHYTVYFSVALQHPACTPGVWHRGKNATAYLIPGLWFDLDLAYGQHAASTLPAIDAAAFDFLGSLPAPPSLIVHSGGGLYGYWLFREPYLITSEAEREASIHLSRQFTYTLVTWGPVAMPSRSLLSVKGSSPASRWAVVPSAGTFLRAWSKLPKRPSTPGSRSTPPSGHGGPCSGPCVPRYLPSHGRSGGSDE